ncbi:MAG: hypothetical protein CVT90_02330, partial [Candidatus Altiarchaeales archaeon HGW-Altiarchaeales-3]
MQIKKNLLDYKNGKTREWLIANGLGGYASSTAINLNTRKYHGLLIAAFNKRVLLLSKLDEELIIDGRKYELSCNKYNNLILPEGFRFMEEFNLKFNYFPEFTYKVCGITIRKKIFTIHENNAVVVSYNIFAGNDLKVNNPEIIIKIKPLVNSRDFHGNLHADNGKYFDEIPYENRTEIKGVYENAPTLIIGSDNMRYSKLGCDFWIKNMVYEEETNRGQDDRDDHYCPGEFSLKINLSGGVAKFNVIAAAGENKENAKEIFNKFYSKKQENYDNLFDREKTRIENIILNTHENCRINRIKLNNSAIDLLAAASDSFIIKKNGNKSIIAGYHWFSDWGRDTMVSLTGLCLVTSRYDDAKEILKIYAKFCRNGIIPNRFNDYGEAEYNTADASLWFFHAVYKFLQYAKDYEFVKNNLWETLKSIIDNYAVGTDNVKMDSDGLIISDAQTTWMDAKIGDFIVTPRAGKCVEINALWYNALKIMDLLYELMEDDLDKNLKSDYAARVIAIKENFKSEFWNHEKGCLYDFTNKDYKDDSIRPNQIFAVSLPFRIFELEKEKSIVKKVHEELDTPYGLRSLSPEDEKYIGTYKGDQTKRDMAYHQGTVWTYLLGHFITAYVKVNDRSLESKKQAEEYLADIFENLYDAGFGSISEIFDGDLPHKARGCISQAWSVAEILRCYCEDVAEETEGRKISDIAKEDNEKKKEFIDISDKRDEAKRDEAKRDEAKRDEAKRDEAKRDEAKR